ncbi:MAG: sugar ABC transporter permease [Devosia sp.]|nr:sugar ABC transporter permease [Devosia sp.]
MAAIEVTAPAEAVSARAARPPLARLRPLRWFYLLPALATFVVWVYEPLAHAAWLSFHEWNMLPGAPIHWVGAKNYQNILALPKLWQALRNTGFYIVGLLPLSVLIPLAIALWTHDLPARARNIYRALIFVPMIVAPVVAGAVWRWLLDPGHGVVNLGLQALGSPAVGFLSDPNWAIWTITFITGWKLTGFSTLILSAANANLDPSLLEAARMDGATPWQIVRHVRLPLLSSTVLFLVMMTILLGAQWSFSYINLLTQGGPLGSTNNIYYLLWDFGFSTLSVGWSSAAAMLLFIGFAVLAFIMFRLIDRYSFYEH